MEAAEKAVLHAIEQEVDSLFHGADPRSNDKGFVPDASSSTSAQSAASSSHDHSDRHNFFLDKKSVSKAKETIKEGVKKAHETVDETQEKRREFLAKETEAALEDYADFTGW